MQNWKNAKTVVLMGVGILSVAAGICFVFWGGGTGYITPAALEGFDSTAKEMILWRYKLGFLNGLAAGGLIGIGVGSCSLAISNAVARRRKSKPEQDSPANN